MPAVDLALTYIPIATLVTSVAELGCVSYITYVLSQPIPVYSFGPFASDYPTYYRIPVPSFVTYLIFCSIWGMLVSAALIAIPHVFAKRALVSQKALGLILLIVTSWTMIFWLSGFATFASSLFGLYATGVSGAAMAFGVITWLLFLGLTILNYLTAFAVVKSERIGYHPMFRQPGTNAAQGGQMAMNPNDRAMNANMTGMDASHYQMNNEAAIKPMPAVYTHNMEVEKSRV